MKHFIQSFKFAGRGIWLAVMKQRNLRIHLGITALVILAAYYFEVTNVEWSILLLCIGLVISLELMNTAIESLVNLISPEWKESAGRIKDISAGAVLWSAIIAVLIGLLIFGNRIFLLFEGM